MVGRAVSCVMTFTFICGNSCHAGTILAGSQVNLVTSNQSVLSFPDSSVSSFSAGAGAAGSGFANTSGHLDTSASSSGEGLVFLAGGVGHFYNSFNNIGDIPGLPLPLEFQFSVTETLVVQSTPLDFGSIADVLNAYQIQINSVTSADVNKTWEIVSQAGGNAIVNEKDGSGIVSLHVDSDGSGGGLFLDAQSESRSSIGASGTGNVNLSLLSIGLSPIFAYQHNLGGVDLEVHFDDGHSMPITIGSSIPEPSSFALLGMGGVVAIAAYRCRIKGCCGSR